MARKLVENTHNLNVNVKFASNWSKTNMDLTTSYSKESAMISLNHEFDMQKSHKAQFKVVVPRLKIDLVETVLLSINDNDGLLDNFEFQISNGSSKPAILFYKRNINTEYSVGLLNFNLDLSRNRYLKDLYELDHDNLRSLVATWSPRTQQDDQMKSVFKVSKNEIKFYESIFTTSNEIMSLETKYFEQFAHLSAKVKLKIIVNKIK